MKLLLRIWPLLASNVLLLLVAVLCMSALSSLRAFAGGESLWSKGQKDAISHLRRYCQSGDGAEFVSYQAAIAAPLGDRVARVEMRQAKPDLARATRGLLEGGNDAQDIPGMLRLLRVAPYVPYVAHALDVWEQADLLIEQITRLGARIEHAPPGAAGEVQRRMALAELDSFDDALRPLEDEFSQTLGESSRSISGTLEATATTFSLAFLLAGLLLTQRRIQRADVLAQELRSSQQQVQTQQRRAQVTLESLYDGVLTTDDDGRVDFINAVAAELTGWQAAQALGCPLEEVLRLKGQDGASPLAGELAQLRAGTRSSSHLRDAVLLTRAAAELPVECTLSTIGGGGQGQGIAAVLRNVSRERELSERLLHQATHDELTGLVNRREFERRLAEAMAAGASGAEQRAALLYLDLDQFKIVNDTCGHGAGDELIRRVAAEIRGVVRTGDTLARLGGDEFGLLLQACPPDRALAIAEAIRAAVAEVRFVAGERVFVVGVSIGVVQLDEHLANTTEALSAADSACYLAKDAGRNRVQVYRASDRRLRSRSGEMNWVARLAEALEHSRFRLLAQRIVPVADTSLEPYYEILLRLVDEEGRLVPPMSFIPAAERYGLMPRLDRWVIEHTLAALGRQQRAGMRPPRMEINLSATSVSEGSTLEFITGELRRHGIAPQRIGFELTETAAVSHLALAMRLLAGLRALGCAVGLDDFGSGMSSFGYLRKLPVSHVKIDGSFVQKIASNEVDRAMVASLHQIVKVMGLRTVAERVESLDTLEQLRAIGVDYAQGYAIERPRPLEEVLLGEQERARLAAAG
jgi:diguanylate cyclase (GGDEF)-like protein/PAS domain S-box-containing protein